MLFLISDSLHNFFQRTPNYALAHANKWLILGPNPLNYHRSVKMASVIRNGAAKDSHRPSCNVLQGLCSYLVRLSSTAPPQALCSGTSL